MKLVKLLYFGRLKESLKISTEELELPAGVRDVGGLKQFLAMRDSIWKDEFGGSSQIRVAINYELATENSMFVNGDEIALFPPVTGG